MQGRLREDPRSKGARLAVAADLFPGHFLHERHHPLLHELLRKKTQDPLASLFSGSREACALRRDASRLGQPASRPLSLLHELQHQLAHKAGGVPPVRLVGVLSELSVVPPAHPRLARFEFLALPLGQPALQEVMADPQVL